MSRPKRLKGFTYEGYASYFLTFCVRARRCAFVRPVVVEATLAQFRLAASDEQFALLAYCFMPDHAHLLIEGLAQTSSLQRFAQAAKRRSGSVYARRGDGALWQEGYYERVLRSSEDAKRIARYILENPVRARLVASPSEYAFLGSDVWRISDLVGSID